jgi:hypothetical protein
MLEGWEEPVCGKCADRGAIDEDFSCGGAARLTHRAGLWPNAQHKYDAAGYKKKQNAGRNRAG